MKKSNISKLYLILIIVFGVLSNNIFADNEVVTGPKTNLCPYTGTGITYDYEITYTVPSGYHYASSFSWYYTGSVDYTNLSNSKYGTIGWSNAVTQPTSIYCIIQYKNSVTGEVSNGYQTPTYNVSVKTLIIKGNISGLTKVNCNNTSSVYYSIPSVTNATSYVWTIPAGWKFSGSSTGNNITVIPSGTNGGTISVYAVNSTCNIITELRVLNISFFTNSPYLTAPDVVAYKNSAIFTINNNPSSVTLTGPFTVISSNPSWKINGAASPLVISSTSFTVTPTVEQSTTTITVTGVNLCSYPKKTISNEGVSTIYVNGPTCIGPLTDINATATLVSNATYTWQMSDVQQGWITLSGQSNSITFKSPKPTGNYSYRVKATTANGYSSNWAVQQLAVVANIGDCNAIGGGNGVVYKGINSSLGSVDVQVYPNPFNSNFTAIYDGEGVVTIEVMDVLGKTLVTQQGNAQEEIKLEMNDAPPGMYLIKITAEGNAIMKKVIKE